MKSSAATVISVAIFIILQNKSPYPAHPLVKRGYYLILLVDSEVEPWFNNHSKHFEFRANL
jgi:hypothetical protein